MSARTSALVIAVLVGLTGAASVVAWREYGELEAQATVVHKAALLESENDGLRAALGEEQRKAADEQNETRRAGIEADVAAIRELPFKKPVVYESLDRAGIRQVVAGKLSEQYSDQEIKDMATGYSAMGLLPPNFPLKQTYVSLLGEQIAAFYDQHQHKLFMFRDASLENSQNRVILAHELTHALQDQNFGLLKLALEIKDNDDRAAAASALIEGDATLVMSQYMVKDLSWKTLADTATYSATQSMEEIRKAPRYMREMLVFPYIKGEQFCAAAYERGGFVALTEVYADPPSSTAQILHPEKYFAIPREEPIQVEFADTTFQGEKPVADNVMGEMGTRLLFQETSLSANIAEKAAAGWRGDRYLVYDGGRELVWKTVWRSPDAAHAAVFAFQQVLIGRFVGEVLDYPVTDLWLEATAAGSKTPIGRESFPGGQILSVARTSTNEVVFILTTNKESAEQLEKQFVGAQHG
jgi:hypothetical protein